MTHLLYKSFCKAGGDQLAWKLDQNRLRVLCYHGVCEDRLAREPWVPQYFVTQSAFESQLRYLRDSAEVLPLSDAAARLAAGDAPPRSVSITFDDGYANNLELAYPLLKKYDMPATIFLSSAYIESGEFYPFLKLRLLKLSGAGEAGPEYKSAPLDQVLESANRRWRGIESHLTEDQRRTLRPLTVDEVKRADSKLLEFGAHSHTHCILKNETSERRRKEIAVSIDKVGQWTGRPVRVFSYPNGERGDFGEADKQVLREQRIQAAVTGIGGANSRRTDPLELRRYPVTINHDESRFTAEVIGFRTVVRALCGRLAS